MILADDQFERPLWARNLQFIVGIDEVGRGAWAGPLVVGAVVFPPYFKTEAPLADSKLLTPKKREKLAEYIYSHAVETQIIEIPVSQINLSGIGQSAQIAFAQAVEALKNKADHVLIDAFKIKTFDPKKQTAIIKGDQQSISIAAASIIAKVYRDSRMKDISVIENRYGFEVNKGYGTAEHRESIAKHGLCDHHRTSFSLEKWIQPLKNFTINFLGNTEKG